MSRFLVFAVLAYRGRWLPTVPLTTAPDTTVPTTTVPEVTDSFGLTVMPFLTQNCKQVHYYDARYYNQSIVGYSVAEMIEKYNIHDIYVITADFHTFNSGFIISTVNKQLGIE